MFPNELMMQAIGLALLFPRFSQHQTNGISHIASLGLFMLEVSLRRYVDHSYQKLDQNIPRTAVSSYFIAQEADGCQSGVRATIS